MSEKTKTINIGKRGVITIPKDLREEHDLSAGDQLTLIDVGGVLVMSPETTEVNPIADRIRDRLKKEGETMASVLNTLREERESYDAGS